MRAEQLSQVSLWLGWDRKKLRQGKLMLLHSYSLKPWNSKLKKKKHSIKLDILPRMEPSSKR